MSLWTEECIELRWLTYISQQHSVSNASKLSGFSGCVGWIKRSGDPPLYLYIGGSAALGPPYKKLNLLALTLFR